MRKPLDEGLFMHENVCNAGRSPQLSLTMKAKQQGGGPFLGIFGRGLLAIVFVACLALILQKVHTTLRLGLSCRPVRFIFVLRLRPLGVCLCPDRR